MSDQPITMENNLGQNELGEIGTTRTEQDISPEELQEVARERNKDVFYLVEEFIGHDLGYIKEGNEYNISPPDTLSRLNEEALKMAEEFTNKTAEILGETK